MQLLRKKQPEKIKWSSWSNPSVVEHGYMPIKKMSVCLANYYNAARKVLTATGADHVVYGMKMYGRDGKLAAMHFYMWAMKDAEFKRIMRNVRNAEVYAVHKN